MFKVYGLFGTTLLAIQAAYSPWATGCTHLNSSYLMQFRNSSQNVTAIFFSSFLHSCKFSISASHI